jgi:hypothetical protein
LARVAHWRRRSSRRAPVFWEVVALTADGGVKADTLRLIYGALQDLSPEPRVRQAWIAKHGLLEAFEPAVIPPATLARLGMAPPAPAPRAPRHVRTLEGFHGGWEPGRSTSTGVAHVHADAAGIVSVDAEGYVVCWRGHTDAGALAWTAFSGSY